MQYEECRVDGFPYDLLARTEDCRVFVSLDTFNTALGLDPKFAHTSLVNRLLQGNDVPLSDHLVDDDFFDCKISLSVFISLLLGNIYDVDNCRLTNKQQNILKYIEKAIYRDCLAALTSKKDNVVIPILSHVQNKLHTTLSNEEDNDVDMKPTDFELELHSEEESAGPSTRSESDTMLDIKPEPHIYSYPPLEQADDYLQSTENADETEDQLIDDMMNDTRVGRSSYKSYTDEERWEIGKYAYENSTCRATRKWPGTPESTIRGWRKKYIEALAEIKRSKGLDFDPDGQHMHPTPKIFEKEIKPGRPYMLGKFDSKVMAQLQNMHDSGVTITGSTAIAVAQRILEQHDSGNKDKYRLSNGWAKSLLRRMKSKSCADSSAKEKPYADPD